MNDPFEKKVRAAAVAGWWVVLIAVGFLMEQALYSVAKQYPKQKFAIIDGQPANGNTPTDLPNVADLFFKPEQSGYLAGVVAGLSIVMIIVGLIGKKVQ